MAQWATGLFIGGTGPQSKELGIHDVELTKAFSLTSSLLGHFSDSTSKAGTDTCPPAPPTAGDPVSTLFKQLPLPASLSLVRIQ